MVVFLTNREIVRQSEGAAPEHTEGCLPVRGRAGELSQDVSLQIRWHSCDALQTP